MTGLLCLKWNNHSSSFLKKLSVIYSKEIYCDATIACQDKFYPVHRLVLSTCSEYFEEIFERVQCRHPFIIVKDICPSELEALLSYMYNGEVHVLQDTLPGLIRAAETLKIKGLAVPETPFSTEHGALNKLKEKLDAAFPSLQRKRIRRESAESSKTNSNSQDIWPSSETNSNRVEPPSGTKSELGNEYSLIDKEDNESIDIKIETVEEQIIDHYDETRKSVPPGDSSTAHMAVLKSPQDNLVSHPVEDNILNSEVNTAQCSSWDGIVEINSNAGVAQGEHKEVAQRPVGRPSISSVESEHAAKRKKGHNTHDIPEVNIRKDLVGHWPMIMQGTERPRCKGSKSSSSQSPPHATADNVHAGIIFGTLKGADSAKKRKYPTEKRFPCQYCPLRFQNRTNLTHHLHTHTGERPFSCPLCPYKAIQSNNLRTHFLIHTGEKPFKCPYCEYDSNQRVNIKRHCQKRHPDKP